MARMIGYSQFCPVAKAAEVFGDRWTPIIMRELCFGTRSFGELFVRLKSPCRAFAFASTSVGSRNPIAAHGIGGWFCAPTTLRFASRLLPTEMSISSSPLILGALQKCGLVIAGSWTPSRGDKSRCRARSMQCRQRVVCSRSPMNQRLRASDFQPGHHPASQQRSSAVSFWNVAFGSKLPRDVTSFHNMSCGSCRQIGQG
jgi:hypothetical protein